MGQAKAEASTASLVEETSFGVAPATGWTQLQPNPGGIQGWEPSFVTVERDPLSKNATMEAGDNVGLDVAPKISCDWNKDTADVIAGGTFRVVAKHPGNTGVSKFRPTAVTATGYTVGALGALTAGLIVHAKGFSTTANNGQKTVSAASTGTEIKTAGLVAEAAPPSNVTLDVVGYQGASGELGIDAAGDLTSTTISFLALGVVPGMWIRLGNLSAGAAFGFATLAYNGRAKVKTVTATKLTLERRSWTVGALDAGAGKTIQIFLPRLYRNVRLDHLDYREPTYTGEIEDIGAGPANSATYTYGTGNGVQMLELDAPLESKIVATISFVGKDVEDPVLVAGRRAGASTAYDPLATALVDTATDLKEVRLTDAAGELIGEINSWKFTHNNNVKAQKVQGVFGANQLIYGKHQPSVSMEVYWTNYEISKARRDNRDLQWDAWVQNHEFGFCIDLPNVRLRGVAKQYAANESIMVSCDVPAFRDPTTNVVASLCVFGYLPA